MTQYPEAPLARELGMCYGNVSLVTDYDAGLEGFEGIEAVTMDAIFKVLEENIEHLRRLLFRAIPEIPLERSCSCREGAAGLT
jgi:5'-methylthioadenosine phosphorylase